MRTAVTDLLRYCATYLPFLRANAAAIAHGQTNLSVSWLVKPLNSLYSSIKLMHARLKSYLLRSTHRRCAVLSVTIACPTSNKPLAVKTNIIDTASDDTWYASW